MVATNDGPGDSRGVENRRIHHHNVRHGGEGRQTGDDFAIHRRSVLLQLKKLVPIARFRGWVGAVAFQVHGFFQEEIKRGGRSGQKETSSRLLRNCFSEGSSCAAKDLLFTRAEVKQILRSRKIGAASG